MHRVSRPLLLALALLLAACGSESGTSEPPAIEGTTFAAALGVNLAASTRTTSGLYYRDLGAGSGATVTNGMSASVRYTLWLPNGSQIETNTTGGAPFTFTVGAGQVIAGWDQGIVGMKVGGSRQLIIPPALGYGAAAQGPIPGNSILVFSVQVVSAQ